MPVSVLSGLARSNLDPWQEAAKLAQLPGETATQRLASLIGALPEGASAYPDPRTIATRLIALLPCPLGGRVGSREASYGLGALMTSRPWWLYVIIMSFVLGSQFMIARGQLPPKVDSLEVNSSGNASQEVPPHPGQ